MDSPKSKNEKIAWAQATMDPPRHKSIFSPIADGIAVLESSIAHLSFEGAEENTKHHLVDTTMEAIQSLESIMIAESRGDTSGRSAISLETPPPTPPPRVSGSIPQLPTEIVCHILSFIPRGSQETFYNTIRVSRRWYFASASFLYAYPRLTSKNFIKFTSIICPSVSGVKHSPFAELVKVLDLSALVHVGSASITARLLRRTRNSLEEFVAPQAQFGINCLVALSHCSKLRVLDLRLASQSAGIADLFQHIRDLPNLRALSFPRSMLSVSTDRSQFVLPARLERFSLAGGVTDTFLMTVNVPETLNELHISHLSFARGNSIRNLLNRLSPQLKVLTVNYHIATLSHNALDNILVMCPNLVKLCIAVDFITPHLFEWENLPPTHPLKQLDLDSSGVPGTQHKLTPDDIYIALAQDRLPHMRILRVSQRLQWTQKMRTDWQDLASLLEGRRNNTKGEEDDPAGIWEFESSYYVAS